MIITCSLNYHPGGALRSRGLPVLNSKAYCGYQKGIQNMLGDISVEIGSNQNMSHI